MGQKIIEITGHFIEFDNNVWKHAIAIDDGDAEKLLAENVQRFDVEANGVEHGNGALMKDSGGYFFLTNKTKIKKCNLVLDVPVSLKIIPVRTELGIDVPSELTNLMEQNREFDELFNKLTLGKQRTLIFLVEKVKNELSRKRKAMAIEHHLIEQKGVLDFKILNETIKLYNNKF
jgi:hypothetical protein